MTQQPDILVTLRPLPDSAPVDVRLRMLLKTALRRDKLRCVSVRDVPAAHGPETKETPDGDDAAH